jgi:hypothetical protein
LLKSIKRNVKPVSIQRPIIGNQGAYIHGSQPASTTIPGAGAQQSIYPGIDYTGYNESFAPVQYPSYGQGLGEDAGAGFFGGGGTTGGGDGIGSVLGRMFGGGSSAVATPTGSGFFNLGQIKQIIDKLGGVEGIMNTMAKVQRMVSGFQQVAPLVKELIGSLGKKKKTGLVKRGPAKRNRRRRSRKNITVKSRQGRSTLL